MVLKPAQQGSHPTLKPFCQTLELTTPSAGEARGGGSAPRGGLGATPPRFAGSEKLLLEKACLIRVQQSFGDSEGKTF